MSVVKLTDKQRSALRDAVNGAWMTTRESARLVRLGLLERVRSGPAPDLAPRMWLCVTTVSGIAILGSGDTNP